MHFHHSERLSIIRSCSILFYFIQIEDLESDCTTAKELYNLIENYTVPTPPEDLAVYQVGNRLSHFNDFTN